MLLLPVFVFDIVDGMVNGTVNALDIVVAKCSVWCYLLLLTVIVMVDVLVVVGNC